MTGTANGGDAQVQCTFTATSTDDSTPSGSLGYRWDGGDTGSTIVRTYDEPGPKSATATATDREGLTSPSGSGSVTIPDERPTAGFTSSCNALTCTFTSTSTDDWTPTADLVHTWSDPPGGGSGPMVTHTYDGAGTIYVALVVTDSGDNSSSRTSDSFPINDRPTAVISVSCLGSGYCSFDGSGSSDDLTPNSQLSFSWDLGETTRMGATFNYQYQNAGTYTITLRVTDADGQTGTATTVITIQSGPRSPGNAAPVPGFTVECAGLACTFTSTSTDDSGIVSWSWSTGDGAPAGTKAVHAHHYTSAGTYRVRLEVRDEHGGFGVIASNVEVSDP